MPKKPKIVPADDDVKAALAEIADHPEITLSRREILRFILVEPTKRSEEIQTILKLDEIGQTRGALNAAHNKLQGAQRTVDAQVQSSRNALQLHLQIPTLRAEDLLDAVNKRRKLLSLPEIGELTADTNLDAGLSSAGDIPQFNKQSALRDLNAVSDAAKGFPDLAKTEIAARLPISRNSRLTPPFLPPCSAAHLSKRALNWSMGQSVRSATLLGKMSSTSLTT